MAPPYAVRRLLLPVILAVEAVILVLLVAVGLMGLLAAPLDRRLRATRLAAMGVAYIALQWCGLAGLLGVWAAGLIRGRAWRDQADLALTGWVLGRVLAAAGPTVGFSMRVEEPGQPGPFAEADPVLVLARHGGLGDSFALVWLLAARYHRRPRIVLKQMLRWEPLIDVALSRMGACFLPPSADPARRLESRVADLAAGLAARDALLIFPEGGNWTPRRRLRAIGRLWASRRPAAARAAALMDHVLPPRAGGVLACLETRPEIPVAVVAHTGLDKITTAAQLWATVPFTTPMRIRWWPPAHPPYGEEERVEWLTTEWAVIDEWIDAQRR